MSARYFAADPNTWSIDPVVAILTAGLDQSALLSNDEVLLIFHDRDFARFFFSNIHMRAIAATTIVNSSTLAVREPPLAQVWGMVSVARTDLPPPFDDNAHPAAADVRGTYRSIGPTTTSGSFTVPSSGAINTFIPVGVVVLCFNANTTENFNACAGQSPSSTDTWRNILIQPKLLLPGASFSVDQVTFKPLNPFPPPGGGTGGGGTGGGGSGGGGGGGR